VSISICDLVAWCVAQRVFHGGDLVLDEFEAAQELGDRAFLGHVVSLTVLMTSTDRRAAKSRVAPAEREGSQDAVPHAVLRSFVDSLGALRRRHLHTRARQLSIRDNCGIGQTWLADRHDCIRESVETIGTIEGKRAVDRSGGG
jgi:hypothetical protein